VWLRGRTSVSVVSMEGRGFYEFRYLKHLMINLAFPLNQGRLKVVTICVTEWGKWLVLFHISCQIYFECKFVLCSGCVFFHYYAYIRSQFFYAKSRNLLTCTYFKTFSFKLQVQKYYFFIDFSYFYINMVSCTSVSRNRILILPKNT
jgi:hypothetical protein